jgi:hypothetical protein
MFPVRVSEEELPPLNNCEEAATKRTAPPTALPSNEVAAVAEFWFVSVFPFEVESFKFKLEPFPK